MATAPELFFGLELPDTIVYKRSEAFVDFNFTFLSKIEKQRSNKIVSTRVAIMCRGIVLVHSPFI